MATTNLELPEITESQASKYVTHNNALDLIDSIVSDILVKNFSSDADYTLSTATNPEEWQYAMINMTDTGVVLTTARNVIVPNNQKQYIFKNSTAQSLTIKTSAGSGIAVPAGNIAPVFCDGTNVIVVLDYHSSPFTIGTLTLASGSITDSSGSISFGNENILTTGTLGAGVATLATGTTIGNLTLANGSITDSGGTISFGDEAITTTGSLDCAALTASGNTNITNGALLVGANDTTQGTLYMYGGATSTGGTIRLYNPADGDTTNEYYIIRPVSSVGESDFQIRLNTTGLLLEYDYSNTEWDFQANAITTTGDITTNGGDFIVANSGNGIDFSATSDASGMTSELLDDYEEGTWTPVLSDGPNNATMSASTYGEYTKVGRKVHIKARVITTSLGSVSGAIRITGLPFTSGSESNSMSTGSASYGAGLAITAGDYVSCDVINSVTYSRLWLWTATTGTTAMTDTEWTADGEIRMEATYYV